MASKAWVSAQRDELLGLIWPLLGAWGLSGPGPAAGPVAVDPEALLLLALVLARGEARLFDELLGLMAQHRERWMKARLRQLAKGVDGTSQRLLFGAWACAVGEALAPPPERAHEVQALFLNFGEADLGEAPGAMAPWGWARPPYAPTHKALPIRVDAWPSLAFKLRAVLGAGAKSEIIRVLLAAQRPLSTREVVAGVALTRAPVLLALDELAWAGWVSPVPTSPSRKAWLVSPEAVAAWGGTGLPKPLLDQGLWLALLALWAAWNEAEAKDWSAYMWASKGLEAWGQALPLLLGTGLSWPRAQAERCLGPSFGPALMAEHEALLLALTQVLGPAQRRKQRSA